MTTKWWRSSFQQPLVGLGRGDAWGVYGAHGDLDVSMLPNGAGAGCIDVRAAWNLNIGPVSASEQAVLAFVGAQVVDLTKDRINQERRSLTDGFQYGGLGWQRGRERLGSLPALEHFHDEGEYLWRRRIDQMSAGDQRGARVGQGARHRFGHRGWQKGIPGRQRPAVPRRSVRAPRRAS